MMDDFSQGGKDKGMSGAAEGEGLQFVTRLNGKHSRTWSIGLHETFAKVRGWVAALLYFALLYSGPSRHVCIQ